MPVVTVFEQYAPEYDEWFDAHAPVYQAELAALQRLVLTTGLGIEVGVGTGRFAAPLGVQFGLDPSHTMLRIARRRGLRVCQAVGEQMPFHDRQFDRVLLVTVICFVDDVPTLLRELRRVLKPGGHLIIGFINRESELGRVYETRKETSAFYRDARLYSVEEVTTGYKKLALARCGSVRPCSVIRVSFQREVWRFAMALAMVRLSSSAPQKPTREVMHEDSLYSERRPVRVREGV